VLTWKNLGLVWYSRQGGQVNRRGNPGEARLVAQRGTVDAHCRDMLLMCVPVAGESLASTLFLRITHLAKPDNV
jgi:hypothetical protein